MKLLIINYLIGITIGIIPIITILLWPEKILNFLGRYIGIFLDYIQGWKGN